MPTLLAAAGESDIKDKLLNGYKAGDMTYKVHLDGYNILSYLTGKSEKSPRHHFFYFSDDGLPVAMRIDDWKLTFAEQRAHGMMYGMNHLYSSVFLICLICAVILLNVQLQTLKTI